MNTSSSTCAPGRRVSTSRRPTAAAQTAAPPGRPGAGPGPAAGRRPRRRPANSRQAPCLICGEALETRLEARDPSERAVRQQPADRQEVAVPAAVVEHRQATAGVQQSAGVGSRHGHRLVDHHGQAHRQARQRDRHVGRIRRATTSRSMSSTRMSTLSTTRTPGCAARACSARSGERVITAATSRPSVASISGAWKTDPASP